MAQFEFRSPLRKLVVFLKASREKWKEKCQQLKYELKLLKRRFDNLRISRDDSRGTRHLLVRPSHIGNTMYKEWLEAQRLKLIRWLAFAASLCIVSATAALELERNELAFGRLPVAARVRAW